MRTLAELQRMAGKVALVTGAAGHVGWAAACTLAELGCTLALSDREERVHEVATEVAATWSVGASGIPADLTIETEVHGLPGKVIERFGRLDVLIHCGAMVSAEDWPGWTGPFETQATDTWRRALEANLTAPFVLARAATPALKQARGSIVMVGSIYGMLGPDLRLYEDTPMGNSVAYAATKGGLLQLTRWLATVLAPDVRVNMITLGGIERGQPERFQDRYAARTPLGRMGREEDVKGAFAFLASGASGYVTGTNTIIDGGFAAW